MLQRRTRTSPIRKFVLKFPCVVEVDNMHNDSWYVPQGLKAIIPDLKAFYFDDYISPDETVSISFFALYFGRRDSPEVRTLIRKKRAEIRAQRKRDESLYAE